MIFTIFSALAGILIFAIWSKHQEQHHQNWLIVLEIAAMQLAAMMMM